MPRHGKKFNAAAGKHVRTELLPLKTAVTDALDASFAKFDETVDVAICLGVDPK